MADTAPDPGIPAIPAHLLPPPIALTIALHQTLLLAWPEARAPRMTGKHTRPLQVQGFSAGSYTAAWIIDYAFQRMHERFHLSYSVLAAIAMPPEFMMTAQQFPKVTFLHMNGDALCQVNGVALTDKFRAFAHRRTGSAKLAFLTPC
jgi:hypothetical protein